MTTSTIGKPDSVVYIPIGLPGCGKTFQARLMLTERVREGRPDSLVRLSRDDSRRTFFMASGDLPRPVEDLITQIRTAELTVVLQHGSDVYLDETNLHPGFLRQLLTLLAELNVNYRVLDFTSVPLELCLRRDAGRFGYERAGESVIRSLHQRHLADESGLWELLRIHRSYVINMHAGSMRKEISQ